MLVPFLFSDMSGSKQRPAVIVSDGSSYSRHGDVIVMAISTVAPRTGDEAWPLSDWTAAGLLRPSVLKPSFLSVAPELIIRQIGSLSAADAATLKSLVRRIFAHVLEAA